MTSYFDTAVALARAADQEIRERQHMARLSRPCVWCARAAYPVPSHYADPLAFYCVKGHLTLVATVTET